MRRARIIAKMERKFRNLLWILILAQLLLLIGITDATSSKTRSRSRRNDGNSSNKVYGLCPDHPAVKSLLKKINKTLDTDIYYISDGVSIKRDKSVMPASSSRKTIVAKKLKGSPDSNMCEYVAQKVADYASTHYLDINLNKAVSPTTGRLLYKNAPRFGFGKNSFLTGFGLGFLAFGLKKLLLPIFIGAQIIKSILIAMFLPSILGSVGKLVGKGVTTFAQSSGSSNYAGGGAASDNINDFDFKDNQQQTNNYDADPAGSDNAYGTVWTYPSSGSNGGSSNAAGNYHNFYNNDFGPQQQSTFSSSGTAYNNFATDFNANRGKPSMSPSGNRYNNVAKPKETQPNKYYGGSFYTKDKTEDFKVFHNIPTSSHLLANYDPFYSPLLSRMDSVFKQLSYSTESCRERLVCNMYKNPAKYAPFSNLVSAQLSRELNELRKPSSDNPEILRFFRYMKAAKDGQDGQECEVVYPECSAGRGPNENAPMVSTFNDINKLVQARSTS